VPISWELDGPDKVEPNDLVTFQISAKDDYGNPFEVKPINLSALLSINDKSRGLCEEPGKRRKTGVGSYSFDFIPRILGTHQLRIYNGPTQLFKNRQIKLEVLGQTTDVTLDYEFEVEGQRLLSAKVNKPVKLDITVKDKGILSDIEMEKFNVKVVGNGRTVFAPVSHTGVGKYQAIFSTTTPGIYTANIIYDENKVMKQRIDYHENTSPFHSVISNIPMSVPSGEPASFTIQSSDVHGNLNGAGGDLWEVKISEGPTGVAIPLQIVDHKNGKYSVEFILGKPGVYRVDVNLDGEKAKKSPFKIKAT